MGVTGGGVTDHHNTGPSRPGCARGVRVDLIKILNEISKY